MDSGKTIKELGLDRYELTQIKGNDLIFLHKDMCPSQESGGFTFACLEFHSQILGAGVDEIKYEVIFRGSTLYDGVRHFYSGSEKTDNYGYLYYLDIPDYILALQVLDDMQVSKCKDVRDARNL
tara:strand:- start:19152 stop:19523 length:372 start_codon:yes stop_codon:yes gene_type:complete